MTECHWHEEMKTSLLPMLIMAAWLNRFWSENMARGQRLSWMTSLWKNLKNHCHLLLVMVYINSSVILLGILSHSSTSVVCAHS